MILRPTMRISDAPIITAIAAIAVIEAIHRNTGLNASIKWPNDVLIGEKKVCGILTEMQADAKQIQYVVVGIGLNVNFELGDFPEGLGDQATSLKIEMGKSVNRFQIIGDILADFENVYFEYMGYQDSNSIISRVRERSATLGKRVKVIGADTYLEGEAVTIESDGGLIIKLDNGHMKKIISGDVSVRGMDGYV